MGGKANVRVAIAMTLGFIAMVVSALYIFFWNYSIYVAYMGQSIYRVLHVIGIKNVIAGSLLAHIFSITLVALTIIGIKYFFDAIRSVEYQSLISGGYAFLGGVSFMYLIGMYIGTFVFRQDYFTRKANTAYFMMIAFILLIIFALYKCLFAKEKAYSFMTILLVAASVFAFLAGGILREDAHYDIVGNGNRTMSIVVASIIGLAQAMPFIFLTYFELGYLPHRIKHPELYEGFIKKDEKGSEGEDDIENEMNEVKEQMDKETDDNQ